MFSIMGTIERYIKIIRVFAYFTELFMDDFFGWCVREVATGHIENTWVSDAENTPT